MRVTIFPLLAIYIGFVHCGLPTISTDQVHYRQVLFGDLGRSERIFSEDVVDKVLNLYVPQSAGVANELCRQHSALYYNSIKNNVSWALRMLDSSSKVPDGILMGNIVQLGNYDECVQIADIASDFGAFSGQHCMVLVGRLGDKSRRRPTLRQHAFKNEMEQRDDILGMKPRQWSLCVPSSCQPSDVMTHLQSVFRNLSVRVDDVNCSKRETEIVLSIYDWFALCAVILVLILLVTSTAYDLYTAKSDGRNDLLVAFSVYTNGKQLLDVRPGSDSLPALEGVRSLSILWVIFLHRSFIFMRTPNINSMKIYENSRDWAHLIVSNGTFPVDSFFLLSGLLVCYNFMKKMEAKIPFNLLQYYTHRIMRLTPAYITVILLTSTLFAYAADGPYWDWAYSQEREMCQKYWWSSLLYVNNYVNTEMEMCLPHGWYLSADMQLYILSPLLLFPLWWWPKIGKLILGTLLFLGLATTFLIPYLSEIRYSELSQEYLRKIYFPTHTRYTPWLIGVGLGYLLHRTKKRSLDISRVNVIIGWLLAAVLMLTSFLLAHRFIQPDHQYERLLESLYISLMRPAWALGLAWVIFACVKGYGGFVNTFLSWSVFQVLGKLSYSLYLIHYGIIALPFTITRTPVFITDIQNLIEYIGLTVFSIAAAIGISFTCEKPFIVFEKYLFRILNSRK